MSRDAKITTIVVVAALLLVPYPTRISVHVLFRAVRPDGSAVSGLQISQKWECYGLSGKGQDERTTDLNGSVQFPPRKAYGSVASRLAARTFSIIAVHASYGARVWIDVTLEPPGRAVFPFPAFKPLEPFATSGTYVDGAERRFFPQEDRDGQRIVIDGDFTHHTDEIILRVR